MPEDSPVCEVCSKQAHQRCSGCLGAYYCGKEHQKAAWKRHKKICRPFKVVTDESLGRHLVAIRDVKPRESILNEPPLVYGPLQHTVAVCLGCGKELSEEKSRPCTQCGWPMCSITCEQAPCHIPECRYTVMKGDRVMIKDFGIRHPMYQSVMVLRCLYQKQFLPEVWKKLSNLESHSELRKKTQRYKNEKITIAQFLLKFYKLSKVFTEEEIMDVCGIIMVNGHEVPLTQPPHVALYETTSMLEHSCRANCYKTFTDEGSVMIIAGQEIKKGDHLSVCYTDPTWGTTNRRHHLHETKLFWCSCPRCEDVTEFETYFSGIKCQKSDCIGVLLPETFLENTTINEKLSDWICNKCKMTMMYNAVQDIIDRIGQDLSQMEKHSLTACKKFLSEVQRYLHHNHFYIFDVQFAMLQLIGEECDGDLSNVTDEDVELKLTTAQKLIRLIRKIAPAEKRLLGILLYELHGTIAEVGRRKSLFTGETDQLNNALLDAKNVLQESLECLKNQSTLLPEGRLYRQGKQNLKEMEIILRSVCLKSVQ